jgi:hypothetical protein
MKFVRVAVRLTFVLGLCLTTLAVGLARLAPVRDEPAPQPARRARLQYQGVNDQAAEGVGHGCRLLDPDSGRIVSMKLPGNDTLLFAR